MSYPVFFLLSFSFIFFPHLFLKHSHNIVLDSLKSHRVDKARFGLMVIFLERIIMGGGGPFGRPYQGMSLREYTTCNRAGWGSRLEDSEKAKGHLGVGT